MSGGIARLFYLFIGGVGKFADDARESPVFGAEPFVLGFQFLQLLEKTYQFSFRSLMSPLTTISHTQVVVKEECSPGEWQIKKQTSKLPS